MESTKYQNKNKNPACSHIFLASEIASGLLGLAQEKMSSMEGYDERCECGAARREKRAKRGREDQESQLWSGETMLKGAVLWWRFGRGGKTERNVGQHQDTNLTKQGQGVGHPWPKLERLMASRAEVGDYRRISMYKTKGGA